MGWADQETTSIPSVNQQQNMLQQQPISSNPILAPTGIPSVDTVNATLASMSNVQILEVINQLKVSLILNL